MTIIAIDLGTTNSLVGYFQQGKPKLISNITGNNLTPSAVALDNDGSLLIGQAALELRHKGVQVITSFKRYIGTQKTMRLGYKDYNSVELSALILGSLKQDVQQQLNETIDEAVITVPAYFNDIQRQATIAAAKMAGFSKIRLINEPTAAALAYGLGQTEDTYFLVFDLGGGTFDVSIVEYFDGVIEVRASTGDNSLGGDDFVQLIIDNFWQQCSSQMGFKEKDFHDDVMVALRAASQKVLHELTNKQETTLNFEWKNKNAQLTISQKMLEEWATPLFLRIKKPIERALRDAKLNPDDIDQIVLVGGATRIPSVRKLVTKLFGRFPLTSVQADEAIVMGACVQAGLQAKDAALKEIVLTDVCPFSLGVEVQLEKSLEMVFSPILERNMIIPTSKEQIFSSSQKGQKEIHLKIYQGEQRLCKDNVFLGELNVNLPPNNEHLNINVRFSYNPNGILDVDVFVPKSGKRFQKVIINNQNTLSEAEIEKARAELEELKVHPRDTLFNKTLLLKADRLFAELKGGDRMHLSQHMEHFNAALNSQDNNIIRRARDSFAKILDQLDQGIFE